MKNLFSDDNSGYRLKTLQILNWGVFDEKVKTFEFDNKSTILTGYNGSGKTTCVDAILTLLIPTSLRWYNLSSESVKKRERDVDNYVLGAWGNTGDSGTKFLRDKTTVSILNGIFNDPVNEKYISLLQVRYFVGDRLDTKYAITEKELRLEKASQALNAKGFSINSDGKWRKILTEEYDTRFYDTFSSYKTFFMDKFGFRSDNALKLFSQTVGMKVLGDMTSFVRSYMLEDKTPEKEFKDLDTEFINLLSIDKDLRKAQLKLEKLEKIHSSIEKWQKAEEEMKTAEQNRIGEELWFYKNAASFGEKEVIERERKIKEKEENRVYYSNEIERVNEIIFSLSQDTSTSLIDALPVNSIINLSNPIPIPPVGGSPISSAVTKSSSIPPASSSPFSLASTCFKNLWYWSIGSFNSEYAFPYSLPPMNNSNLSTNLGSSFLLFVRGETSTG